MCVETEEPITKRGQKYYGGIIEQYKCAAEARPCTATVDAGVVVTPSGIRIRQSLAMAIYQLVQLQFT